MTLTVAKLHKILEETITLGRGNMPVGVDLDTFNSPNDDATVADVGAAKPAWVAQCDGDGWTETNADGTEKGRTMLLLCGE